MADAHDCACWIGTEVEGQFRGQRILCIRSRLSEEQKQWVFEQEFALCFFNEVLATDFAFMREIVDDLRMAEVAVFIGVPDSAEVRGALTAMPAALRARVRFVYRFAADAFMQVVRMRDTVSLVDYSRGITLTYRSHPVETHPLQYEGDVGCPC